MEDVVLLKVGQGKCCLGAKMAKHRCKSSKKLPVLARVYILVMKKASTNEQDSCDECDGRLQIGAQQTYPCRISPQDSEKYVKVHDDDDDDDDEPTLGAAELKLGDPRFIFVCVRSMAMLSDDTHQNASRTVCQFRSCSSETPGDVPYYVSVPRTDDDSPMTLLIKQMDSGERSRTRDTSDCGCFYFKGTTKSASFESTRYPGCYMAYHSSSETLVLKHVTMKDGHTLPDDPDIKFRLPKLEDVVDCPLDIQEVVKALQTGLQEMDLSDQDSGLGDSDDFSDSDSVSASSVDDGEACPVVDLGTEHNTTSAGDIVEVS